MEQQLTPYLDEGLRRTIKNVRGAVVRVWRAPLHRHYTDHTVAHSERIIALLDGLTDGMMSTDQRLSSTEVFVLLAAAYLHDIGMQDERYGELDEIRSQHHELSAELIYRAQEDPDQAIRLGLPSDPGLVEAVALVSKGHRKVDLSTDEYDPLSHGDEVLRLRLLAALLRFADELDIDHRRVDLELMKLMNLPLLSQLHWWKCHYVSGVSIVDEYIRITYRFPRDRPDYEQFIVPLVERDVREKLTSLEEIFRRNAIKLAIGRSQSRLMRLVQPLPAEVEALAIEMLSSEHKQTASADQNKLATSSWDEDMQPARTSQDTQTLPAKQGQEPGVPVEQPSTGTTYQVYIQSASGLAIGDRAQVFQSPSQTTKSADVTEDTMSSASIMSGNWTSETIRRLLAASFSDVELTTLCFDHFRVVYEDFAAGMSKSQKVQRLLDYCDRQGLMDQLLHLVQERNPAQYDRFRSQLR